MPHKPMRRIPRRGWGAPRSPTRNARPFRRGRVGRAPSCDTLMDFVTMSRVHPRDLVPMRVRGVFSMYGEALGLRLSGGEFGGGGVLRPLRGVPSRFERRLGWAFSGVFRGAWRRFVARFWERAKNGPRSARSGLHVKPCARTARRAPSGVFGRSALI